MIFSYKRLVFKRKKAKYKKKGLKKRKKLKIKRKRKLKKKYQFIKKSKIRKAFKFHLIKKRTTSNTIYHIKKLKIQNKVITKSYSKIIPSFNDIFRTNIFYFNFIRNLIFTVFKLLRKVPKKLYGFKNFLYNLRKKYRKIKRKAFKKNKSKIKKKLSLSIARSKIHPYFQRKLKLKRLTKKKRKIYSKKKTKNKKRFKRPYSRMIFLIKKYIKKIRYLNRKLLPLLFRENKLVKLYANKKYKYLPVYFYITYHENKIRLYKRDISIHECYALAYNPQKITRLLKLIKQA